jgi:hypothetical protein
MKQSLALLRILEVAALLAGLLASLLALSACARVQVRLGMKVQLDKIPVKSMEVRLPNGPGIAPGEKLALVAVFTSPDGHTLQTEGAGRGKVLWKDLNVSTNVVTANQKGVVSLSLDPRISEGKVAHVTIAVPSHPGIRAELDIPLRYDRNFTANFSGMSGSSGFDGSAGLDGASGSSGSMDPNHPSAGGDGSDGRNGSDGQNGGSGWDGPPVRVRVALSPVASKLAAQGSGVTGSAGFTSEAPGSGSHPLLQVSVSTGGGSGAGGSAAGGSAAGGSAAGQTLYLIDPQGGSVTVKTEGGDGGSGGRGGRGGRGGSGGIGTPNGQNGHDGLSGHDGWKGSPGKGGSITVTYDPQAKPFLGTIHLSNRGGPAPVFKEEPVAPLW